MHVSWQRRLCASWRDEFRNQHLEEPCISVDSGGWGTNGSCAQIARSASDERQLPATEVRANLPTHEVEGFRIARISARMALSGAVWHGWCNQMGYVTRILNCGCCRIRRAIQTGDRLERATKGIYHKKVNVDRLPYRAAVYRLDYDIAGMKAGDEEGAGPSETLTGTLCAAQMQQGLLGWIGARQPLENLSSRDL